MIGSSFGRVLIWILLKFVWVCYLPLEVWRMFLKKNQCPPVANKLLLTPAIVLAEKIRNRDVKSEDVIKAYIERIKQVNPIINAIVEDRFESALIEAKNVENILNSGLTEQQLKEQYPLLGLPLTVKGSIPLQGLSNSAGVIAYKNNKAEKDAICVRNARRAGAIPLAITNTPELCLNWETYNKLHGLTRNPHDTRKTAGGSSGGEAALMGAGASLLGIGSDIAGSLRLPTHYCGVFGHKPTPRLISIVSHNPEGTDDEWAEVFNIGPITRYASDLLFFTNVIAEPQLNQLKISEPVNLKDIKVYYFKQFKSNIVSSLTPTTDKAFHMVLDHFNAVCNTRCQEFKSNLMHYSTEFGYLRMLNVNGVQTLFNPRGDGSFGELFKFLTFRSEHNFLTIGYGLVRKLQQLFPKKFVRMIYEKTYDLRDELLQILDSNSVLIMPVCPQEASYHYNIFKQVFDQGYCAIFNSLGFPATSCPVLKSPEGLPVGIQIVASANNDRLTLEIAHEIERAFGGWEACASFR